MSGLVFENDHSGWQSVINRTQWFLGEAFGPKNHKHRIMSLPPTVTAAMMNIKEKYVVVEYVDGGADDLSPIVKEVFKDLYQPINICVFSV